MQPDAFHGLQDADPGPIAPDPIPEHPGGTSPCRIAAPRPSPRLCSRVSATLSTISPYMRTLVYEAFRLLGGKRGRLNDHRRELLSDAIFQVENVLEHRQPEHPQVQRLRAARNRLYDDLGWNERPVRLIAPQSSAEAPHAA
jgi:hypothetical protein